MKKIIFLFFCISGACGLVYEVLWGKYLSLFIGNTTHAHMMVLATFMGGLAAGSYFFGFVADRVRKHLKLYAWLELGIGFYAVLYPAIVEYSKGLYFQIASSYELGSSANILSKLSLSFLTIILPTFLMGGTLPVLSKFVVDSLGRLGRNLSLLYFVNSLGAVAGTLIAGFYMIESFGLKSSIMITGITNLLVGLGVLLVEMVPIRRGEERNGYLPDKEMVTNYDPLHVKLAIVAIFLSGFTSMIYELVWIRLFAVVLGSSTYSFSLMLVAFISGITVGSLLVSRITASNRRFLFLFGLCELAIMIAIIAGLPFYERLPYYFWKLRYLFKPVPETFIYYHVIKFVLCFAIMFIPTVFFGMSLPFVTKIVADDFGKLASKIGHVYGANTLGTLFGALLTGLVFIPLFGLKTSLEIAFLLNFVIATVILLSNGEMPSLRWRAVPAGFGLLVLGFYFSSMPSWNKANFATGFFRYRDVPPPTYLDFKRYADQSKVVYYKEDVGCNVAVVRKKSTSLIEDLVLTVNGKSDASSHADMATQILLGQLPLLFKNEVDDVLIVGLGSGTTAGTVLSHPVKRVDCVEISPAVAEAAKYFSPFNHNVLNDPKFHLVIEDATTYLKTARRKYDVIISEPSNPWIAGVGNLFSAEFFQEASNKLKPGGLVVQWFHNYEMTNAILATVIKTFNVALPYTYVFQGNVNDLILLGSKTEIRPEFLALEEKLRDKNVKAELEKINVFDLPSLLALQMFSPGKIQEITVAGEINRDDRPILEYRAPLAFYLGQAADLIARNDERFNLESALFIKRYIDENKLTLQNYRNMIRLFRDERVKNERLAYSIYDGYFERQPDDKELILDYSSRSFNRGRQELALSLLKKRLHEDGKSLPLIEKYVDLRYEHQHALNSVFNAQDFTEIIDLLKKSLSASEHPDQNLFKLGEIYFRAGLYTEASNCFVQILGRRKESSRNNHSPRLSEDLIYVLGGKSYFYLRDYEKAKTCLEKSLRINSRNSEAAHYLLAILERQKLVAR